MSTCRCSMAISMLGDGCRYCQPQTYIDHLLETLDTGAERNAMQRERDAYKLLLDRECNDSDSIFMALGVAPDSIRTEGGFLMVAHLVSLISAKSEKLETLLHEAIPGLQHLSDTAQDIDTFTLVARVKSALSAGKEKQDEHS